MRTEQQLVMDRPQVRTAPDAERVGSTIKTILFHVHDDRTLDDRMEVALSIARACGAHLHLLHVTPLEAYTVVDAFGVFVSGQIVEALQEDAKKLRVKLQEQLVSEDVTWDYEEVTGALMPHMIQCAALADLVITGREPKDPEFVRPTISLLGDLLQQIRTPILLIGDETKQLDPFGVAIVAWNGSYEAANALRNAVGLLKLASEVRLVRVEETKDEQFPSTRALEYLSRHGISAELVVRERIADSVTEELLDYAAGQRADLLIMGGYSHSRAGEFLFGGVTRDVLKGCPIPVLISR